jgi:hypothetical protein
MGGGEQVIYSSLEAPMRPDADSGLQAGGVVLLAPATTDHAPELLLEGRTVTAEWGLPSPGVAKRFPGVPGSAAARFRATDLPPEGELLRLVVRAPDRTLLLTSRQLPPVLPSPRLSGGLPAVAEFLCQVRTDCLDLADFYSLDASLRHVPHRKRGEGWRRTRILLNVTYSMYPRSTLKALQEYREECGRTGVQASWQEFWSQVSAALGPRTISIHGYQVALGLRPPGAVWSEVARVVERLREYAVEPCVISGTLLGLVRDGELIGHDDDVDLAVVLPQEEPAKAVAAWRDFRARAAAEGLLDLEYEELNRPHAKLASAEHVAVDLFPGWCHQGRAYVWPHTFGDVSRDDLLPLSTMRVHDVDIPLPANPEPFLVANYGQGWQAPDPLFTFDWSAARARFGDLYAELSPRSAVRPDSP